MEFWAKNGKIPKILVLKKGKFPNFNGIFYGKGRKFPNFNGIFHGKQNSRILMEFWAKKAENSPIFLWEKF